MAWFMRDINIISRCGKQYREARFAGSGLNSGQSPYILNVCREPGITQEALAKRICVNKSNVARQLAMLEEAGFVERRQSETDRRAIEVYPTDRALEIRPFVRRVLQDWRDYLTVGFTDAEKEQLEGLLSRLACRARGHQMFSGEEEDAE